MKMTYAQAIDTIIAVAQGTEVETGVFEETLERLDALKAQLAKRGSGKHTLTKTQKEGLELIDRILEMLADAPDGMTATEIGDALDIKCQRASALLAKLTPERGDGRVRREKVGKQVRFFLA